MFVSFTEGSAETGSVWAYDPAGGSRRRVASATEFDGRFAVGDSTVWVLDTAVSQPQLRVLKYTIGAASPGAQIDLRAADATRANTPPALIAADATNIWVVSAVARSGEGDDPSLALWRVDPASDQLAATVPLQGSSPALAAGAASAWVTIGSENVLLRFDATGEQTDELTVGRSPVAVAVGEGSVWVANGRDGTVSRVDPESLDVSTIAVGGSPRGIAAGEGAVWVTVDP